MFRRMKVRQKQSKVQRQKGEPGYTLNDKFDIQLVNWDDTEALSWIRLKCLFDYFKELPRIPAISTISKQVIPYIVFISPSIKNLGHGSKKGYKL